MEDCLSKDRKLLTVLKSGLMALITMTNNIKAINELVRVTKSGGNIFISLPIASKAIIQYNGHRVYTPSMIIEYFKGCHLKDFKWISENKEIIDDINSVHTENIYWCEGLFWFVKD